MDKFTNPSIVKEQKRKTRGILISILLLAIGIALGVWGFFAYEQAIDNAKPLNDIIESEENNKEDKVATLVINSQPYLFAEESEGVNGYFIVTDEKYMYIAYMSKYDELVNKTDLKENPTKIEGTTKLISKEVKELALEAYNQDLEEEQKLTLADFESYFGDVCLDMSSGSLGDVAMLQVLGAIIFLLSGTISLIITIVQKVQFGKTIKKMDESTIQTLDDEMNRSDAFYYEKLHLYLTNNYVINFSRTLKVIEYRDIIWMYTMNYRTNGIKTKQSIKVMTKNGKVTEIAEIDTITKSKKEMYEEIWNTIVSKNPNIILGYTKEAQEQAKELIEK